MKKAAKGSIVNLPLNLSNSVVIIDVLRYDEVKNEIKEEVHLMIKALVFDLDGTIIDTEKSIFESYKQAFQYYNFDLTLDVWSQWVGGVGTPQKACHYVGEETGQEINYDKIQQIHKEAFFQLIKEEKPLPGVLDMLESGKRAGLKIGLATNSNSDWANYFLQTLKINDYFDNVFTFDHVKQPKPDPEIYKKSVDYFHIVPHEAIAFEDSIIGSLAAKDAQLYTIAIPSKLTKEESFEHVDLKVDSMKHLNLHELIDELTMKKREKNPISLY